MLSEIDYNGLSGIVVTPDDPEYKQARQVYNRAIQKFPIAIVFCRNKRDVCNAVLWAQTNRVGIRIRSGRHNYEGYSVGNAILVIDVSHMNGVYIDGQSRTLTIGAGATNGAVYTAVAKAGLPFAGGSCPTVGVSGYAMGGGWNFFCRNWGMGCDWLEEIQMVNDKGRLLTANEHRNADLYWACRGGGDGNFGVIVSMKFRLPPTPGRITFLTLYKPNATAGDQEEYLNIWQQLLPGLDNRMTMRSSLFISEAEGRAIYTRGIFFGPPQEARKLLRPLVNGVGLEVETRYVPFAEAVDIIGSAYPESEMFQSTGRFVNRMLTQKQIGTAVSLLNALPEGQELIELGLFALGGRVSDVPSGATAFYFRHATYILQVQSVWTDPAFADEGRAWVRRAFRTVEPMTMGSFVNFPYAGIVDYEKAYYGGNIPRLRAVKRRYDPENVFRYPQSIRAAKQAKNR